MARHAVGGSGVNANEGFAVAFAPQATVRLTLDGGIATALVLGTVAILMAGVVAAVLGLRTARLRQLPPDPVAAAGSDDATDQAPPGADS